jgi:hypothetical protein
MKDKDKHLEESLSCLKKICRDYINDDGRIKKKQAFEEAFFEYESN